MPVNENNEFLEASIDRNSPQGELIRMASVIIWDEAPMANRAVLECVEETCRRVMDNDVPFGGKVVILLGDFRQTCPVIQRGTRVQVVDASIKSSPLWQHFKIFHLLVPIRNAEDLLFATVVDAIGDGAGPSISLDMLDSIQLPVDLIDFVFPVQCLNEPVACVKRSILAPTNRQIDAYNATVIEHVEGVQRTYLAADSLKEADEAGIDSTRCSIIDYVARENPPGLPPHSLAVKTNAIYRLLQNFSLDRGLMKNMRVFMVEVGHRLVKVRMIRPNDAANVTTSEDDVLIPRISFTYSLPSGHTLLRRQFPIAAAYATTFNSCQGLTLDAVGVDLTRDVFSHGQLYTALSRIRHRSHAKLLLRPGESSTTNVTFLDILL